MYSNTIVAARVPEEIKQQGNAILASLGYTPTELINSAYHYVLEFRKLPFESAAPKAGRRTLEPKRLQQIADELELLQVSTYDYSQGGTQGFKEALEKKLKSGYEAQS